MPAELVGRLHTGRSSFARLGLLLAIAGCGSDSTAPPPDDVPARIMLIAGDTQYAAVAMPVPVEPVVEVQNAAGKPLAGVTVTFQVVAGAGWTERAQAVTDARGRARSAWYLGPEPGNGHRLQVAAGSVPIVTFRASALPLKTDSTYFGRNEYIEFRAGALPLVLSAPHGGTLAPVELPDRTAGETVLDVNTLELTRAIADALAQRTGRRPHLVLCRLARTKLDPNRDINEGAGGGLAAERAWREWHGFLEAASAAVQADGAGLYLDIHGHGHALPRVELGYLLSAAELALGDVVLDNDAFAARTSIRALAARSGTGLARLLRGPASLGTLLDSRDFPTVPSEALPAPGSDPYFSGGYDTDRHGSRPGGMLDAIQVETYRTGLRDTEEQRRAFATALADALHEYFRAHYERELR